MQSFHLHLNFPNDKIVSIPVSMEQVPKITPRTKEIFAQLGCEVPEVTLELSDRMEQFQSIQQRILNAKNHSVRDKGVSFVIASGLAALVALSILGFLKILPSLFFEIFLIAYAMLSSVVNIHFLESKSEILYTLLPPLGLAIPIYQTYTKVSRLTERLLTDRDEIQRVLQSGVFEICKFYYLNEQMLRQKLNQYILDAENAVKALQSIRFQLRPPVKLAENSLQEDIQDLLRAQLVLEIFKNFTLKVELSNV